MNSEKVKVPLARRFSDTNPARPSDEPGFVCLFLLPQLFRELLFVLDDREGKAKSQDERTDGVVIIRLRLERVAQHQAHGGDQEKDRPNTVQQPVAAQKKIIKIVRIVKICLRLPRRKELYKKLRHFVISHRK